MPMLEPKELEERRAHRAKRHKRKRRNLGVLPLVLTIIAVYMATVAFIPPPALKADIMPINLTSKPATELPWPAYGQAAIGAVGFGMLAQHGEQKPLPIASVAKVITAVAVLKQRPINKAETIPTISISADDVAAYQRDLSQDQSVIRVEAGEVISEYQALQALLLPSANNMADVLARWAFGTSDNYLKFVNPFTKTLGMKNTTMADASGFSSKTVSTAEDLAKLAEIAMNNPTIAEIVNQAQADLPVAGTVFNVNRLVGRDGVVGIKTGNTDEAGGCYMFSVRRAVEGGQDTTLVGVVVGAGDLTTAIHDSIPLINAAFKLFHKTDVVHNEHIVGKITQAGQTKSTIITKQALSVMTWDNLVPTTQISTNKLGSTVNREQELGRLDIKVGDMVYSLPIVSAEAIPSPSYSWRLRHAAGYL